MRAVRATEVKRGKATVSARHLFLLIAFLALPVWASSSPHPGLLQILAATPGEVDSGYSMGNTDQSTTLVVPYFSGEAYIAITNLAGAPQTISIEYRDPAGNDRTPASSTYELPAGGSIRWAPLVNDPVLEGVEGSSVPDMTGDDGAGSALITGTEPLAGILELRAGDDSWSSLLLSGLDEAGPTLRVASFEDASLIAIRNLGAAAANVALVYQGPSGPVQMPAPFQLPAGAAVRWGPLLTDTNLEGTAGAAVPDLTGGFAMGSVTIASDQPLAGQLELDYDGPGRGYTLAGTSVTRLAAPYFNATSLIGVVNAGAASANAIASCRDLANSAANVIPFTVAVNETYGFMPALSLPAGSGHWNADIAADQPLAGFLDTEHTGGGRSAYRLRGTDEVSQVLTAPYLRKGSFLVVQNVSPATVTVTVAFRDLSGGDRTPILDAFDLLAGHSARWSPFTAEKADGLPAMTGDVGEGSAIISGTMSLAGQVELAKAYDSEDVNGDGAVNAIDIQLVVNAALGIPVSEDCDVNGDGEVNAVDIQLIVNKALE